ncbi:PLC-like phosphodiesterase [Conidiobolus coronatus NRRL 28638]|uniref:glycerophosphodiester phosphodiesterase n=1 Tax=Conidiobolus coronatus (strain ATCC 28846 / CBS 209.66 / NRRL 28638) TaxID=796925 RepID=A0A137NUX3_CONC2|nr:PLC-like phosphodiesterase [Conidiobolus coronatus NRRL 28638]|eukprot:KXN66580.1 PLC-like phosphodiesterase [Conidiobolus coronatus NRRL 28638]
MPFSALVVLLVQALSAELKIAHEAKWPTLDGKPTLVFGHRGDKAVMPQHTIGSYHMAAIEGADFVEPDLVATKDGHLVCYHDLYIKEGTDVEKHPEFAHLKKTFNDTLDGKPTVIENDWFISDFTLAELKTLKVRQKNTGVRPLYFDKVFEIPTFEEYLTFMQDISYTLNKTLGLVPELKHPVYHQNLRPTESHWFEDKVLSTLKKFGYPINKEDCDGCYSRVKDQKTGNVTEVDFPCGEVVLQNFDFDSLKYLRSKTDLIPLVMLNDDDPLLFTRKGLDEIAKYANWYSPWKEYAVVGVEAELADRKIKYDPAKIAELGGFIPKGDFVKECHKRNLRFVPYTFYDSREKSYRGCSIKCYPENKREEFFYFFNMGADGLFCENTPEAIQLRTEYNDFLNAKAQNITI